jgi:3-hydroxy-9,10-secoandrosta-1,3,5(10)-triene-9,17-dione monooxygenase reductase component
MPLVKQFKIPDWQHKFDDVQYRLSPRGNPVLDAAIGFLDCEVERVIDTGDHSLFIGKITHGEMRKQEEPLTVLQYPGRYRGDK